MLCAFEGPPLILRLYGHGRVLPRGSADYAEILHSAFAGEEPHGTRQIVVLDFDLVQTSCGYGVPHHVYQGERPSLPRWAKAKTDEEIRDYWREENAISLDGKPTGIVDAREDLGAR
jgi:hypothetical protein